MSATRFLRARVVRDVVVSAERGVVLPDGSHLSGAGAAGPDAVDRLPTATARLPHAVFAGRLPAAPARLLLDGFSRLWLPTDGPTVWIGPEPADRLLDQVGDLVGVGAERHVVSNGAVAVDELLVLDPAFTPHGVHPALVARLGTVAGRAPIGPAVWLTRPGDAPRATDDSLRDAGWTVVSPTTDGLRSTVEAVAGASRVAGRPAAILAIVPLVGDLRARVEPVSPEPHALIGPVAAAWGWQVVAHAANASNTNEVLDALRG